MIDLRLAVAVVALVLSAGTAAGQAVEGRMGGLQLSGDDPIQIESDRLEVREGENLAVFSGNVSVAQGQTTMRAGRMTVHYARGEADAALGAGGIERIEVEEEVYVRSAGQVATGQRADFDMRGRVLVMTGSEVVLAEGDNVIVGCRLTVQMASGRALLEGCAPGTGGSGRVRMLLRPGSER